MYGTDEKTIISAQMPTIVRDRLAHLAVTNERSLSGELRRAVDTHLRLNDVDFSGASSTSAPLESPFAMTAGEGRGSASASPAAARRENGR
jgi:hypothetical protein